MIEITKKKRIAKPQNKAILFSGSQPVHVMLIQLIDDMRSAESVKAEYKSKGEG